MNLKDRLSSPGPKRILSLDGGGIRGALTLGYLEKIESVLRKQHQNPQMRLCDYFDLIGGTSTGAIIAAALAIGKTASEVKELYLKLGGEIFGDKKGFLGIALRNKYDEAPLKLALQSMFGDMKMGDEGENGLKTGLCIVTKRMDTFSTWPLTNHPDTKYFDRNRFFVRDIVRASTAAPSYFTPEVIDLGGGEVGTFVDGGMSMMNNPALQMFLMVTVKGYPFGWKTGSDQLKIVSIGTGTRNVTLSAEKYRNPSLLQIAQMAPEQFMHDAAELVEILMQYFSESPTAREIDKNFGKLEGETISDKAAFSYLRYNIHLDRNSLNTIGMTNIGDKQLEDLTEMDDADNRFILSEIGDKAAQFQILENHFSPQFRVQ